MKKIFALLMIMSMTIFFTACDNGSTTNTPSEKVEEEAVLVNICEGKLFGGMSEEDAIAYVENELCLTQTDYIVNGEKSTNAFYEISDVKGLGKTKVTLKFDGGLLCYISFSFLDANWDDVMTVVQERLGDNFTTEKSSSNYTRYNWAYNDASVDVYKDADEEASFVLYVNYNMEYQY